MTDRPTIAFPPEMAQQIAMQQKLERTGRQLLESLACQIYVQLAAHTILSPSSDPAARVQRLEWCAAQSLQAAFPMAAELGWRFQAAPLGEPRAPELAT